MMPRQVILIAHNLRSCHNIGSLLRTAEGLGIQKVYLSGYTPYPESADDARMPHERQKIHKQIQKTALGAEKTQAWEHTPDVTTLMAKLKQAGFCIVALEQAKQSVMLPEYRAPDKVALIVGREVEGIEPEVLALADDVVEIPMFGQKESFNVVQAAAMALYQLTFVA